MKRENTTIIIILLLFNIILTLKSLMLGFYSSIWMGEGKIGLVECYAKSYNILSFILVVDLILFLFLYLLKKDKDKLITKILVFSLIIFSVAFFVLWGICDFSPWILI